jgi:hypothetical protein
MSGGDLACEMPNMRLSVNHVNSTFIGTYASYAISCLGPTGEVGGPASGGAMLSDLVKDEEIEFSLNGEPTLQEGAILVQSMSGRATWTVDFGLGIYTLTGDWVAVKVPSLYSS